MVPHLRRMTGWVTTQLILLACRLWGIFVLTHLGLKTCHPPPAPSAVARALVWLQRPASQSILRSEVGRQSSRAPSSWPHLGTCWRFRSVSSRSCALRSSVEPPWRWGVRGARRAVGRSQGSWCPIPHPCCGSQASLHSTHRGELSTPWSVLLPWLISPPILFTINF